MSRYHFDDDDPYVVIEKHESAGITPFLVGLALGAGAALLLAPQSGRATRRDIRRGVKKARDAAEQTVADVTDSVVGRFEDARQRVEDRIDSVRNAIDLKKRQVTRAVDAGRAAAVEARLELEQEIAESKAAHRANEA